VRSVVLDTNVLVSFLTDRDAEQQARAAELIERGARNELRLVLPQIVATELVYVLTNLYEKPASEAAGVLRDLLGTPGVEPLDELPWSLLLDLWPETVPGFADAALVAVAKGGRHEAVATFDRGLRRTLGEQGLRPYWGG
jgi:predicted nucleic acid-binding protein